MEDHKKKAAEYFKVSSEFKLGDLVTEKPHPETGNLSDLSKSEIEKAIDVLKSIDYKIFDVLISKVKEIINLRDSLAQVIKSGGRVFLCGCGSTGRLSLGLEVLWREIEKNDSIVGVMAGGDTALISAIEDFEDHPEFAKRHLKDLGFKDGDILIAITEGGETPFVIGAALFAQKESKIKPYFLYCNPDLALLKIKRSKRVLENNSIRKINLTVGPMAVSGSTRMQASTVLMYAVGLALFEKGDEKRLNSRILGFKSFFNSSDFSFLKRIIELESETYLQGNYSLYKTNLLGIAILTDTTERSPTFNLDPFENFLKDYDKSSKTYLQIIDCNDPMEAWKKILHRKPRALDWPEFEQTSSGELLGFNFSTNSKALRESKINSKQLEISILKDGDGILFECEDLIHKLSLKSVYKLEQTLVLKMVINIVSTLVMGRLSRFEGNVMTYVKPSCNKLIDRAIRYVQILLEKDKISDVSYKEIGEKIFELKEDLHESKPIVLKTYNFFKGRKK